MNDFLSTHCNPPNAATLEVLAFELRDEIKKLRAERDDATARAETAEDHREAMRGAMESAMRERNAARLALQGERARGDRLEGELARLAKERDDLARAVLESAVPLKPCQDKAEVLDALRAVEKIIARRSPNPDARASDAWQRLARVGLIVGRLIVATR